MGRLPSLSTVLVHEVDRYNILLKTIHTSIENLQRAIKGFVVMSEELENICMAFVNNQVLLSIFFNKVYINYKLFYQKIFLININIFKLFL